MWTFKSKIEYFIFTFTVGWDFSLASQEYSATQIYNAIEIFKNLGYNCIRSTEINDLSKIWMRASGFDLKENKIVSILDNRNKEVILETTI